MSDEVQVYTGVWTNWSHGSVHGRTLTLPQQYGGFISAFLALYVSFAGGLFWRMLSFALHQARATNHLNTRDWLHHQRQVILRNSGMGSGGAAWSLFVLSFKSKGPFSRAFLRCLPFALLALLTLVLFSVASVFTSAITKAPGNSTLVTGPSCGGIIANDSQANEASNKLSGPEWQAKILGDTVQAATYVRQCYQNTTSSLSCGNFVRPNIPFTINRNESCPFQSGLCEISDTAAFSMDTGLMDSHFDFGINAAPKNRILFRRKATCAPIHAIPFAVIKNTTFGQTAYIEAGPASVNTNYTFFYVVHDEDDGFGYALSAVYSIAGMADPEGWTPATALQQPDADITLMMLAQNDVTYLAECDDPWMPAHLSDVGNGVRIWVGDYWVNLMSCIDQYQICNPNIPGDAGCTPLSGSLKVAQSYNHSGSSLNMNAQQLVTATRFMETSIFRSMYYAVNGRGASALNVQEHAYNNVQFYVPPTQWQTEVSLWFSNCLVKEQQWALEWATAPTNLDSSLGQNISSLFQLNKPTNEAGWSQCKQQMIRDGGGYMSFSVLGMVLILVLGGLMIIVGWTVDLAAAKISNQHKRYKHEEWEAEETMALHKTGYVASGYSPDSTNGELPPIIALASAALAKHSQEPAYVMQKGTYYTAVQNEYSYGYGYNGAMGEIPIIR